MKFKKIMIFMLVSSLVFSNNALMTQAKENEYDNNVKLFAIEESSESEEIISEEIDVETLEASEESQLDDETDSSSKEEYNSIIESTEETTTVENYSEEATTEENESDEDNQHFVINDSDFNTLEELESLAILDDYSIMAAAKITTQPKDVAININSTSTVQLKIAASGTGLKYQWQESTNNGSTFANVTGANKNTFTFTASLSMDKRKYRCVVTDKSNNQATSNAATLRVLDYKVTSEPQDTTVTSSDIAKFTVATNGSNVTYQWQRLTTDANGNSQWSKISDGSVYTGTTSSTLSVVAKGKNGSKFRCVIVEENGLKINSRTAVLKVANMSVSTQPKDQKIWLAKANTVSFSVTATGVSSYQWQESSNGTSWNNINYSGYNTKTVTVPVNPSMNQYRYRCLLTNSTGSSIYSNAAILSVSDLKITTNPTSVILGSTDTATLTVAANGRSLKYQWQVYTTDSSTQTSTWSNITSSSKNYSGYDTQNLKINVPKNGARLRCKVTDDLGYIVYSAEAKITVSTLKITTQPVDNKVKVGDNTSISFTVKASGSELKYQWMVSTNNGSSWSNSTESGNNTATLTVSVAASKNRYKYKCRITDATKRSIDSNAVQLSVSNLAISTQPTNQTVYGTEKATFTIKATGNSLKYQWQVYSTSSSAWTNAKDGETYSGATTATLKVTNGKNNAKYRCIITDEYSYKVTSNTVVLTVKPNDITISTQPKSTSVTSGNTATFKVVATGNDLKYQWMVKSPTNTTFINVSSTDIYSGLTTNTLTVKKTTGKNGFQYKCKITDKNGNIKYTNIATLTVK